MNETKYGMARSLPHLFVPRLCEFGSQVFFDMHDNIICCQLSPVAHLVNQSRQQVYQAAVATAAPYASDVGDKQRKTYRHHQFLKPLHTMWGADLIKVSLEHL